MNVGFLSELQRDRSTLTRFIIYSGLHMAAHTPAPKRERDGDEMEVDAGLVRLATANPARRALSPVPAAPELRAVLQGHA
jgi:hypothetical protein